uniref:Uncharacterized protein n=1 Tax=Rhizophagus irregularis (strain DAOM 181602 / DAOM 197198 / MUCL 43194) TaxID=747089 RepID=U9TIR5_RHIID
MDDFVLRTKLTGRRSWFLDKSAGRPNWPATSIGLWTKSYQIELYTYYRAPREAVIL